MIAFALYPYSPTAVGAFCIWARRRSAGARRESGPARAAISRPDRAAGITGLWSVIFFRFQAFGFALLWLALLWVLVLWMTVLFYRVKPWAGYLQIPYLVWITFAAYLNFGVWRLNSL